MKFIVLILMSFLAISCGKNSDSSKPFSDGEQAQEQDSWSVQNGYIDASIKGESELLNITFNESVIMEGGRITFNRPVTVSDRAQKSSCSFSVNSGEIWQLNRASQGLELLFPDGSRQSLKPASTMGEILGSWSWSGAKNGIKIFRRYTFLPDRVIVNQDCEG